MTERPILFSGPMVRAILNGRKTQTRRALKPPPFIDANGNFCAPDRKGKIWNWGQHIDGRPCVRNYIKKMIRWCPGDRAWVRETWWIATRYSYGSTPGGSDLPAPPLAYRRGDPVWFASDGEPPNTPNRHYPTGLRGGAFSAPDPYAIWLKTPSIHMPRWASRITLEITDVRVERLQDISEEDAVAEGIVPVKASGYYKSPDHPDGKWRAGDNAHLMFRDLWNSTHGDGAWDQNPWVAALTFRRIEGDHHG